MTGGIFRLAARAVFLGIGLILVCAAVGPIAAAATDAVLDPSPTVAAPWSTDDGDAPAAADGPAADDSDSWSDEAQTASSAGATDSHVEDSWTVDEAGTSGEDGSAATAQQALRSADEGQTSAAPPAVGGEGSAPSDGTDPAAVSAPRVDAPAAASEQSATFELAETDGSGVSGTATLSATDGGTAIALAVGSAGTAFGGLVFGACGSLAIDSLIPLGPLDASGALETQVPGIPLESLRGGYAVIAYALAGEGYAVLACGDVPAGEDGSVAEASNEADDASTPAGGTGGITDTGVGTTAVPAHGGAPFAVILIAAGLLAVGGVAARRIPIR